jgi:hypothetical protein
LARAETRLTGSKEVPDVERAFVRQFANSLIAACLSRHDGDSTPESSLLCKVLHALTACAPDVGPWVHGRRISSSYLETFFGVLRA